MSYYLRCNETDPDFSQISGWKFDDLAVTIQQRSCEALLLAGHTEEAGESVLRMVGREVSMSESLKTWVPGELSLCPFASHLEFQYRFRATMSFCTEKRSQGELCDPRPQQCFIPNDAIIERVGEIKTVGWVVERCVGFRR